MASIPLADSTSVIGYVGKKLSRLGDWPAIPKGQKTADRLCRIYTLIRTEYDLSEDEEIRFDLFCAGERVEELFFLMNLPCTVCRLEEVAVDIKLRNLQIRVLEYMRKKHHQNGESNKNSLWKAMNKVGKHCNELCRADFRIYKDLMKIKETL